MRVKCEDDDWDETVAKNMIEERDLRHQEVFMPRVISKKEVDDE